jgi:hypothetical protein
MIVEWLEIITPPGDSPQNGNENICGLLPVSRAEIAYVGDRSNDSWIVAQPSSSDRFR